LTVTADGDAAVRELLSRGAMRLLGLMPRASNYTFLAEVGSGRDTTLAVYKPRAGETPLWDFPEGTLHLREVAAYELSRALGWPHIPFTTLRDGPHGAGSVQLFVEADGSEHYFTLREAGTDRFRPIAAFDILVNNADRKSGHCLLAADGTVWVVDHGTCFAIDPKLRTVIWDFAGDPVPTELVSDLARVARELRSGELRGRLGSLLSDAEVDETARRAETLVRASCFPGPGPGRPYPWPPV
jgi:hypothetical protein